MPGRFVYYVGKLRRLLVIYTHTLSPSATTPVKPFRGHSIYANFVFETKNEDKSEDNRYICSHQTIFTLDNNYNGAKKNITEFDHVEY